ncbi:hypothetical protein, partial [Hoylesella buccalis]|uniref:hypothetical protein n=1 Tax=Hoylesella buccalis TaxID=28127 RepID=UPI001D060227
CIADCALRGLRAPGRMATSAVFFMFFVQSKHQQFLHFDFESLVAAEEILSKNVLFELNNACYHSSLKAVWL